MEQVSIRNRSQISGGPRERGKVLVYHTAPFESDTEVSGFFKLSAWLAIDQPDTDFSVSIYEIRPDASSILLSTDLHACPLSREIARGEADRDSRAAQYDFEGFTFVVAHGAARAAGCVSSSGP